MLELKVMNRLQQYKKYIVYENLDEVKKYNVEIVPYNLAQPGDYVATDNGYYVPIISRGENGNFLRLRAPFSEWYGINRPDDQRSVNNKYMVFNRSPLPPKYDKRLNTNDFLFAQLIIGGTPLGAAFHIAYPNVRNNTSKKMKSMLRNTNLINYIREKIMSTLSHILAENDITYESIAQLLAQSIKQPANLQERKWAVDTALLLIDTAKQETIQSMQNALPPVVLTRSLEAENVLPSDYTVL